MAYAYSLITSLGNYSSKPALNFRRTYTTADRNVILHLFPLSITFTRIPSTPSCIVYEDNVSSFNIMNLDPLPELFTMTPAHLEAVALLPLSSSQALALCSM